MSTCCKSLLDDKQMHQSSIKVGPLGLLNFVPDVINTLNNKHPQFNLIDFSVSRKWLFMPARSASISIHISNFDLSCRCSSDVVVVTSVQVWCRGTVLARLPSQHASKRHRRTTAVRTPCCLKTSSQTWATCTALSWASSRLRYLESTTSTSPYR